MPYTKQHKQKSREKILASAAQLFSRHGYDNISIDDIMANARLTRGAFYNHFENKSELYGEAISYAASVSKLIELRPEMIENDDWLKKLIDYYISREHIEQREIPCPLSFLATDVANKQPQVKSSYTNVFRGMVKILKSSLQKDKHKTQDHIYAATALMIGAVAVGRTLDHEPTRRQLLASCRKVTLDLLETGKN